MSAPTISVVVPAYNAEPHVAETLRSILSQTHPPDEVIVVDDGSTDGTPRELMRFRGDIRVIRQSNRGAAGAHNTGFGEARGHYVARCDADDLWEPMKLERQVQALTAHPEIDIATSGARVFGAGENRLFLDYTGAAPPPCDGIQKRGAFAQRLYRANMLCASSAVIRRRLHKKVGPFTEPLPNEDYDYWLRALKAGAVFFYDPTVLVRYRRHETNVTNSPLALYRAAHLVHTRHADLVDSASLVDRTLAADLFMIARLLVDDDHASEARKAFVNSLRHRLTLRGLVWALVLSTPEPCRRPLADRLVSIKRALYALA
jgi:glycosyltransferase involved in cell wall biosynthesis